MATIENPFQYPEEGAFKRKKANEYQRRWKEKKLGRELGTWGGKRAGAGRPKTKTEEVFKLNLNKIQKMNLKEIGDGDIERGIQRLIDKHV